jgi:hypothetical protein
MENNIATQCSITHTTSVCSLSLPTPHTLMQSDTHNPHPTDNSFTDFCCKHNTLYMLFTSRTFNCLGKLFPWWGQVEMVGLFKASMLLRGDMEGLNSAPGHSVTDGAQRRPIMSSWPIPRDGRCATLRAPKTVCAWRRAISYSRWPCWCWTQQI